MINQFNLLTLQQPLQIDQTTLDSIAKQLELINENLSTLTKALSSQSFWNSQLFAAIIGATVAILVLLTQQAWNWRRKRKGKLDKIFEWIAEQHPFWTPETLYDKASRTSYGTTVHDNVTGETKKIPEKPLGEKMVIELRRHVKYWQFPSYQLRKYFKEYEKSLAQFNNLDQNKTDHLTELLSISDKVLLKITDMAFRETGENEWTI